MEKEVLCKKAPFVKSTDNVYFRTDVVAEEIGMCTLVWVGMSGIESI